MNKLFKKSLAWGLVCLTVVLLSVSCKTPKNISYFQDIRNGQTDQILHSHGIQLKPGDAISIVVKSKSVELTNALNLPVTAQVIGTPEEVSLRQSQGISNYTIDDNGDIDFPVVGKIQTDCDRCRCFCRLHQSQLCSDGRSQDSRTIHFQQRESESAGGTQYCRRPDYLRKT